MIIGLLVSIFLGRTIGADGLGVINLSHKIINILIVLGLVGMQQVIIKEVAIAKNKEDFQHIGDVMYTAYWINGGISIILSVSLIVISPWLANSIFKEPRLTFPLMVALLVMTPQIFSRIFSSALVGYRKIWQSNLVDQTLSTTVTGTLLLIAWLIKVHITINLVAIFYAIGRLIVTISIRVYWKSLFRFRGRRRKIRYELFKTSIPLMFVSMTLLLASSIDSIMLGWLSNVKEVGLYSVALQLALLTSFFLQVTNSVLMPKIAALYSEQKLAEITRYLTLLGVLTVGIFIILGKYLLKLWGTEFIEAYTILIILSIGQFFNIASGPVGSILVMCNYEKILRNITIISLVINIILNYLLIGNYGAKGAAIATAFTIAIIMSVSTYFIKKRFGFLPFGLLKN